MLNQKYDNDRAREAFELRLRLNSAQAAGEVTGKVTGEVVKLLQVLDGPMKSTEIQSRLSLKHEEHFRNKYLNPVIIDRAVRKFDEW